MKELVTGPCISQPGVQVSDSSREEFNVASRVVLGFSISLEDPSAVLVPLTLVHAVLPKDLWLADRHAYDPQSQGNSLPIRVIVSRFQVDGPF